MAAQRNRPALLFLESLGAPAADGVFRLPAKCAAGRSWSARVAPDPPTAASRSQPGTGKRVRPSGRLRAHRHRTPHAGANLVRDPRRRTPPRAAARRSMPPRTALERDLVALWAELLNVEAVGIHENFFELGGHSLLAVQLLSRVRQIYGVELSLEVVYSGEFMVAELAKAIELKEIEQAGGDYQRADPGTRGPERRGSPRPPGRRAGCHLAHADPADRQCQLRAAARRRHAQQPDLAGPDGRRGPRLPHRLRRRRRRRRAALSLVHRRLRRRRSLAPHTGAAPADSRVPARLGAGLERRSGTRTLARSAAFGPRPRGVPGPHAAVLSLRPGQLESRPRGRGHGGRGRRRRGHRASHGGLHRALAGPRRGGDSSADLRRRARSPITATSTAAWSP